MAIIGAKEHHVDPQLSQIAQNDKTIWYKKPNLRFLYLILIPTGLGVEWTSGFDSSMMNSLQAVSSWFEYFGRPNSSRLGLLSAIYSLGALMAILCPLFQPAFRYPFAIINASSLIGELSYAKERPIMTSWFVGAIVAAGITFGTFQMTTTWAWRIPKSPRWLISKDRGDEAFAILNKYHSGGRERRGIYHQVLWADVFRGAAMRRRFMLAGIMGFFTQWSGNGLISFYMKKILNLVGITDNHTVQRFILGNTCWGFINAVPIALIAPRFARRKMFLTCTIGTACVYTVWTVASARFAIEQSQRAAIPVLVFIFVYSPFYNIGWNALA
ncbi:hypothetical protein BDP55DRAFT_688629 [Colletotrichum godetiae]|uniref:Major facilitator superfamily (MFS) profile domain-containing protein n=1 Tax=Colletotrichum godetiae TaxID=1209918 RepID=A0AAJ0EKL3_9PEZI|nr:uncharacterized protein BDP55DRAFT_688629 [Colletotrichum godetiae]KAK1656580.1 hypothetical protein BDP55DRAFT_688629 [Colletotrichum godetiae]